MFLFSFYFSVIDYFKNQERRYKLGEKKLGFIIIIRDIIFGIIQLTGFILLLYSIFLLPLEKYNYSKIITLLIFGCLSYCFSLYSGINICKELNK